MRFMECDKYGGDNEDHVGNIIRNGLRIRDQNNIVKKDLLITEIFGFWIYYVLVMKINNFK